MNHEAEAGKRQNGMALGGEKRSPLESKVQQVFQSPVMSEPSTTLLHHGGHKFHEVFQIKQGRYSDLPAAKISEMMKSNSLDSAPTQSLLSVMNAILDESIERKNGEIPQRVACLLRKVVQEIERRISTQVEHIRNQNNLIKAREEKYQSRIRVLETLATGTGEETQILANQISVAKRENNNFEKKQLERQDMDKLTKEKENNDRLISDLRQELTKEKENNDRLISDLRQELAMTKKKNKELCQKLESEASEMQIQLEMRIKEAESLLAESRKKTNELEASSESKFHNWNRKENIFHKFVDFQIQSVQDLRTSSESIRREVIKTQNIWCEETNNLGLKLKVLVDAADNYHVVLAENRKLYNEVLELKGNIRVYCRIRPFLPGEAKKATTVDFIGDNGEISVVNPSKQGKDGQKMFKFNKVYSPSASQEDVYLDTQPLVRSVLDGYNVCIFAYGQTGAGKTYTMSGPNTPTEKTWGINYRALNDLFDISRKRTTFAFEIGVQMVEIYNEQVRDLLSNDGSQKRLGILTTSTPNGLAVPDATMNPVKSTSDVLQLMEFGQTNRAMSSTALNERSSRSHSVLTVHVRAVDTKTGSISRGCLHLIDLAGSERVDRSEVTGDRLKEAQHINKSLSALGDVIFALAQKSNHVPYRNSKLTQVLQSSLGGQAKTLMFVQISPNVESYSETLSTLKFAERVSGVELGAARSNKEGKDVRELMEQVASLKDTIAKKDEEIEQLQQVKDLGTQSPKATTERRGIKSLRHSSSSPRLASVVGTTQHVHRFLGGKGAKSSEKTASDPDNSLEFGDKCFESGSQQSEEYMHYRESVHQLNTDGEETGPSSPHGVNEDANYEERLSDESDADVSMATETDGSRIVADTGKIPEHTTEKMPKVATRVSKLVLHKTELTTASPKSKDLLKSPSSRKSTISSPRIQKPKP